MECNFNDQMKPQWFNFYANCARSSRYRGLCIEGSSDPESLLTASEEFFNVKKIKAKKVW